MIFAGYPITPASLLLHTLANLKAHGVITFQAEDEIAAIGAVIGAAYAGVLGVTSSSGPGMALKTEMLGLAIATELPLVVVNSQRAGPSTGMPTKAEQSDLFQAVHGRNADAPLAVIAPATASAGRRPRCRRRGGLGLDVRRDSASGPRSAGGRDRRLAHPPSLSEPVPVELGRPAQAVRPCARAGDE